MINGYCVIFLLKPAMSVILNSKNLITYHNILHRTQYFKKKVQVGKDQEKAQSEKESHSKNPKWVKTKLTIRYLYHENISLDE